MRLLNTEDILKADLIVINNCLPSIINCDLKCWRWRFQVFDNGKGYIKADDLREIMKTLGDRMTDEEIDEMMYEAEVKDGMINIHGNVTFYNTFIFNTWRFLKRKILYCLC